MELAGAAAGAGQRLCDWPEPDWQQGLPPTAPESISDFLLLRVLLVCGRSCLGGLSCWPTRSRSRCAALCGCLLTLAGLLGRGRFGARWCWPILSPPCRTSCSSCWSFSPPFYCWLKCQSWPHRWRWIPLSCSSSIFSWRWWKLKCPRPLTGRRMRLRPVFVFFFFFLVVVVEAWSSVELAWGLAMAEIPLSTKNMQSAMVHILSLVCSLLMISSLVPDRSQGTAEACLRGAECFPTGRKGRP